MQETPNTELEKVKGPTLIKQWKRSSFKVGNFFFFKKARRSLEISAEDENFSGHGVGLFLGENPPGFKGGVNMKSFIQVMGSLGFISFDDITEFLGKDKTDELFKRFEGKYYPPTFLATANEKKPTEFGKPPDDSSSAEMPST